jgi:FlaA1/EpsC-like NDP-sugar epimerase
MHEGASFLLQSLALRNSRLLLPEMGAPRKIIELAGFLQRWFDVENHNRPMISIGLRDGEKLCEQITYDFEYLKTTELAQVYEVCGTTLDPELFMHDVVQLRKLVVARRKNGLLELLLKLVPEFHPSSTLVRYLV